MCTHVYFTTLIRTRMYIYIHRHVPIHMQVRAHTHAHHTHTHTHTYTLSVSHTHISPVHTHALPHQAFSYIHLAACMNFTDLAILHAFEYSLAVHNVTALWRSRVCCAHLPAGAPHIVDVVFCPSEQLLCSAHSSHSNTHTHTHTHIVWVCGTDLSFKLLLTEQMSAGEFALIAIAFCLCSLFRMLL